MLGWSLCRFRLFDDFFGLCLRRFIWSITSGVSVLLQQLILGIYSVSVFSQIILDIFETESLINGVERLELTDGSAALVHIILNAITKFIQVIVRYIVIVEFPQQLLQLRHMPPMRLLHQLQMFSVCIIVSLLLLTSRRGLDVSILFVNLYL